MRRPNLSAMVYLVLVFASGVVVGSVGYGFYNLRSGGSKTNPCGPDAVRHRYLDEMRTRLSLRSDQIERLSAILDETRGRFHALREKYKPEVSAIQEEQAARVRTILDEKQRAEYEKMRQERERERHKSSRLGRHGRSGG
jgi:hypothetical protein